VLVYSPAVFLALAENTAGQIDLRLFASSGASYQRLNFTAVQQNLGYHGDLAVPRIISDSAPIFRASSCSYLDSSDPKKTIDVTFNGPSGNSVGEQAIRLNCTAGPADQCLKAMCTDSGTAYTLVIQSDREKRIGLGRSWPYVPVPPGSVYIHQALARTISVVPDDFIYLSLPWQNIFALNYLEALNKAGQPNTTRRVEMATFPLRVDKVVPGNYGKAPFQENDVVFIEWETLIDLLPESISPLFNSTFRNALQKSLSSESLEAQASDVYVSCSSYRIDCYIKNNYASLSRKVVDWASEVVYSVGFTEISSEMPVLTQLFSTRFLSAFLNLIFTMVVVFLGALSYVQVSLSYHLHLDAF
jgi:hypothetical protein